MNHALFLGCGNDRRRKVRRETEPETYPDDWKVYTVDIDPNCGATCVFDMDELFDDYEGGHIPGLPFLTEFDEINAFDSLEHWSRQGDFRFWFREMEYYYQLLKPGGAFNALVPIGEDAFNDPGHTRFFSLAHFLFLTESFYEVNKGKAITDYRWLIKHFWEINILETIGNHHIAVRLIKPEINDGIY